MKKEKTENLITRPPVVVVLGHVDHGKTSLLDYVKRTKIAEKESGGITQHIGAYEIIFKGSKITFIDTPGHEAFSKIRSQGAKIADIAILVVAADEGVKPQTIESLLCIKEADIPFVVAITKMDKEMANSEKVKQELLKNGVLLEKMGGDVPFQEVSAKTGSGIDDLLEMVLLVAEMEELKADPEAIASGAVIESYIDRQRGNTVTLIITNGTLHHNDEIRTISTKGKIKIMEDFLGKSIKKASFSSPVQIIGFERLPLVGEKFVAGTKGTNFDDILKEELSGDKERVKVNVLGDKDAELVIPLVIKSDVLNSKEALEKIIDQVGKRNHWLFRVLRNRIGDISDDDLKIADNEGTLIVGFRVQKRPEIINTLLSKKRLIIINEDVIYELEDKIEEIVKKEFVIVLSTKQLGKLEVLAVFNPVKKKQLIGGRVLEGKILNKAHFSLWRDDKTIASGKIINLQRGRNDVNEVETNEKCGLLVECSQKIEKDDLLDCFQKI